MKKFPILPDFQDYIYLNDKGRYGTRLPFKESYESLPDNYSFCKIGH